MLVASTDSGVCLLEFVDRRMLPTQVQRIRQRLRAVFVPDRSDLTEQALERVGMVDAADRNVAGYSKVPVRV